ncbi:MAG: L,D-transpeptidase family protein [Bacteroidia bacterium]|nr:L,D-transpeptidase family protein [Bacteroidia bacterium]
MNQYFLMAMCKLNESWYKSRYVITFQKYSILLVAVFALAGCHRNLTPVTSAVTDTELKTELKNAPPVIKVTVAKKKVTLDVKPLRIDTLQYSIRTREATIRTSSSYFDNKVRSKSNEFYTRNNFKTKWLGKDAPNKLYYAFIDIIKKADRYGLHPEDYPIHSIDERLQLRYPKLQTAAVEIYDLDMQLTDAFFLFTTHLIEGRITNTNNGDRIWIKEAAKSDDITILLEINDAQTLLEKIERLHPEQEQYQKLLSALERYRTLQNMVRDDFPIMFTAAAINPNDVHEMVPLIRRKLELTDWKLDSLMIDSTRYDEVLVGAVKWFQFRHGLEPDGIIGVATLKFLNQSYKEKSEIIELNLERMRWIPETYGDNYITVNVPEYKLRVFENKRQGLEMKVIVGSEATATPIFSDTLRYIVFMPTWSVPNSIIRDEIILRLQKDSTYYGGKNYTFYKNGTEFNPASVSWNNQVINSYNYAVVQQPGKSNSLGLVKFIMPNKMSIYLHDTPNHNLFNRTNRALSHGCVRLDDPDMLAAFLLKDQKDWRMETIDKAMNSDQTKTVFLTIPYPVYIEYRTAWVDENGLVNFREDIYGHDKRQLAQLKSVNQNRAEKLPLVKNPLP